MHTFKNRKKITAHVQGLSFESFVENFKTQRKLTSKK